MKKKIGSILSMVLMFAFLTGAVAWAESDMPRGMFGLYEQNRDKGIPNYITEDFILLAYGMVLNETVTEIEESLLYPEFKNLTDALIKKLNDMKPQDKIAAANLDYLNVLACLLSGADQPKEGESADGNAVADELKKIRAAEGIALSELMKQQMDYSQFKVRGKYTRNESLSRYFQAMKYAGTVLFPILESKATGVTAEQADFLTQQAMAMVDLINKDNAVLNQMKKFEDLLAVLFGAPDDLSFKEYDGEVSKYRKDNLPVAEVRKKLLEYARKNNRQPSILSGLVNAAALEDGVSAKDVLTGWRLMPQRFTPDSAAFQQLVYNQVGVYKGQKEAFSKVFINGQFVKGYPMGLELMTLLGSKEAGQILDASDERKYEGYEAAASQAGKKLKTSSSGNINIIKSWLTASDFIKDSSQPDESRRLNTCLGFWTYTRYISILYAKQSYTMLGKGFNIPPERKTACIEPAPALYSSLAEEIRLLLSNLRKNRQGDISKATARLGEFQKILKRCRDISQKKKLVKAEIDFLNNLDVDLLKLIDEKDLPIIVDVHTEPTGGNVLEQGLGYPKVVEKSIGNDTARGALFTYYEFKHPMKDRLTDEKWREMLANPEAMKGIVLSPGSTGKYNFQERQ
jgi:hypothetical protein